MTAARVDSARDSRHEAGATKSNGPFVTTMGRFCL